jgi:hypothetical protein
LAKLWGCFVNVLDFSRALRPGLQPLVDQLLIEWRHLKFPPNNKVIIEDGVFEVGELGIAFELDSDVLIFLAFITYAGFARFTDQGIEALAVGDTTFNDLLDQSLFELAILAVEVIGFIA